MTAPPAVAAAPASSSHWRGSSRLHALARLMHPQSTPSSALALKLLTAPTPSLHTPDSAPSPEIRCAMMCSDGATSGAAAGSLEAAMSASAGDSAVHSCTQMAGGGAQGTSEVHTCAMQGMAVGSTRGESGQNKGLKWVVRLLGDVSALSPAQVRPAAPLAPSALALVDDSLQACALHPGQ